MLGHCLTFTQAIQYGEDLEPREPKDGMDDDDNDAVGEAIGEQSQ